jgi:hypothetical protein
MAGITFDPGEPLDIEKLNQLSQAVVALQTSSKQFGSSTTEKIAKVWTNAQEVQVTPGTEKTITIDFSDAKFSAKPRVIAMANNTKVSVALNSVNPNASGDYTQAVLSFTSPKGSGVTKAWINWVAIAMETNA